ncbi:MAG TPA: GxxExxY protein, partial [Gemmatimonadales bacterium]|nr:GxxExxY protein [Gemmatimonadales bacterium]
SEVALPVFFKGEALRVRFRVDLVCYGTLVVELKAQPTLGKPDLAQLLNYLKAASLHKALLINFGAPRLQYRRLVL